MQRKINLMEYLPVYYLENKTMQALQQQDGVELEQLYVQIENAINQFFVPTATEEGLKSWEEMLAIPRNLSLSVEERREVIVAKLRGSGTTTVQLVKEVSESFAYGEVEVIEKNASYTIRIKFVGKKGIPKNLDGLKKALREIVPAHLDIEYEFTYMTWAEFERYNKTIAEWDALNLTAKELMEYQEG